MQTRTHSQNPKSRENPSQKSGDYSSSNPGMVKKQKVQKFMIMIRFLHTFSHFVYVLNLYKNYSTLCNRQEKSVASMQTAKNCHPIGTSIKVSHELIPYALVHAESILYLIKQFWFSYENLPKFKYPLVLEFE